VKKTLAALTLGVTAASMLAGCSSGTSSSADNGATGGSTIKIAVLEPFSGPVGYLGTFVKNSVQIEVDKLNKNGGVLGHKIEVITRDDQLTAQATVAAARELVSDPSVVMIQGPSISSFYNAVRPIYEQSKKLNCPLSVDSDSAVKGAKYTFLAGPNNGTELPGLLKYLSSAGKKTIGLVYSKDATGEATDTALKEMAPKYNIRYLGVQYYNAGAQNHVAQMTALKDADAIFISGTGSDAGETAITAQQIGYKGVLVGNDGEQSYVFVDAAGDTAQGTTFSSEPLYNLTDIPQDQWPAAFREFVTTAQSQYGVQTGPKSGVTQLKATPLPASCVVAWAKAAVKANSIDPTKVAAAWETMNLTAAENPAGVAVQFTPDNHSFWNSPDQIAVYKWAKKDGKWYLQTVQSVGS
jgi:branched-chain amino acid transport system substrate-binding protein